MVFDEARGEILLFGGLGDQSTFLGDTWAFDGTSWAISDALPVPGTTFGGTMTIDDDGALWHDYYDTANDRQLAVFAPTATGYTGPSTFAPSGTASIASRCEEMKSVLLT